MGRPREHGPETRAALLAAAGALVHAEGTSALTVRRLAQEVGTTTRAVYSLFGDKDGLLRALFREVAETMRRHHEAVPVRDDPTGEILELALAFRAAALEQPNLYELYLGPMLVWTGPRSILAEEDIAIGMRSFDRVLDAVRRCVESGRFPRRDPRATTGQLSALVYGLASLELRGMLGDRASAPRMWTDAVTAAVTGYQAAPARRSATARRPR